MKLEDAVSTGEPRPMDPLVEALTPAQVHRDVDEFIALFDAGSKEEDVHQFLATHSYFFNNHLRLLSVCPLYSKIRLGSEFTTDFAWFDTSSFGPEWTFVEIESAAGRMFTKSGEPSALLNHAIQQARDWQQWISDNIAYAREQFPHVSYPMCYVFVGRRSEFTPSTVKRLRKLSYDHRAHLKIHTLDNFVGNALSVLELMKLRGGAGNWYVPMCALTHAEFAARKPEGAWKYLAAKGHDETLRYYHDMRIGSRISVATTPEVIYEDDD
ncbi:MAG: DUF4263 domain-containing protein [Polyangiaceae bacterium]|nr:DUF4263 domain-containing protein [Polyangiaceae bacterium]